MKVVALVSGGKDSCYSALLAQQHGHEIVALANLVPADAGTEELDSYMYQTVGHGVVEAWSACCGLPLFRWRIRGSLQHNALVYEDTRDDEVEDLAALLQRCKGALPELQAVSCGAIASDYQRTRVERVAARVGLVPLAFMWHQPQARLLRDMTECGVRAVLVKIAAAGLSVEKHLGAELSTLVSYLHVLRRKFGGNVCGEGGEFETLVVDAPLFTHAKIELESWEPCLASPDAMAPVAYMNNIRWSLVPKTEGEPAPSATIEWVEDDVEAVLPASLLASSLLNTSMHACEAKVQTWPGENLLRVSATVLRSSDGEHAAMHAALSAVQESLSARGLSFSDALFVHLFVPSMQCFAAVNAAYLRFLPAVNPPARATVELEGEGTVVDVLIAVPGGAVSLGPPRKTLHVQSVSDWAPACIGPYAQSVAHAGLVLFAGQIGLDPGSMELVAGGAVAQCHRCLLSSQNVAVAQRTHLKQALLWATVYVDASASDGDRAAILHAVHSAWGSGASGQEADNRSEDDEPHEDDVLDEYLVPPSFPHRTWSPSFDCVVMPALPRGALVELEPVAADRALFNDDATASSSSSSDEEGEQRPASSPFRPASLLSFSVLHGAVPARLTIVALACLGRFRRSVISVPAAGSGPALAKEAAEVICAAVLQQAAEEVGKSGGMSVVSCRLYLAGSVDRDAVRATLAVVDSGPDKPPLLVPATALVDSRGDPCHMLLELLAVGALA